MSEKIADLSFWQAALRAARDSILDAVALSAAPIRSVERKNSDLNFLILMGFISKLYAKFQADK